MTIDYYNSVDAVLIGEIIDVHERRRYTRLRVKVIYTYKGRISSYINIDTERTSCALKGAKSGETWLFYARTQKHRNATNRCMRNSSQTKSKFASDTAFLNRVHILDSITFKPYGAIGNLQKGVPEGYWRYYSDKESATTLTSEGSYSNGKRHGLWKHHALNGSISSSELYENGVLLEEKTYTSDSVILSETYYQRRSRKEKIDRQYYTDGTLYKSFTSTMGGLRTRYEEYYPNGQLKETGYFNFLEGYSGKWSYFDSSGQLLRKGRPKD